MASELAVPGVLARWLERDLSARFVVRSDGEALWQNQSARTLGDTSGEICLADGRLTSPHPRVAEKIDVCLGKLADEPDGDTCAIPASGGDGFILLRATCIDEDGCRVYCIQALITGRGFRARYEDFDVAFKLTPAECRVVELAMDGLTPEQTAARTATSVGTVRAHIRNIYRKLDVHTREGMFHRIKQFRVI